MELAEIRRTLRDNPSKEFLIEFINASDIPAMAKMLIFQKVQSLTDDDINKFSKIAMVAIQYIETGNQEGLDNLMTRLKVPSAFAGIVKQYVANIPVKQ